MRWRSLAAVLVMLVGAAGMARAQQRRDAGDDLAATMPPAQMNDRQVSCAPAVDAGPAASFGANAGVNRPSEREPCSEAMHAAQFEDVQAAERAYGFCRGRVARAGHIPVADDVRMLEDVTEALHGLRRSDGAFCVAPSAPFELNNVTEGVTDTRTCLIALDRFLSSDNAVWRFVLSDPYSLGRLVARGGVDAVQARRLRQRPRAGSAGERELVAIARLAGRHFMRMCRCLPGPQPDSVTAVRAMQLPHTVESVLIRALEEREDTHGEP